MLFSQQTHSRGKNRIRLRAELLEAREVPATFTVNSTGDAGDATPGDGIADTWTARVVTTTLRAAIEEGNALAAAGLGSDHTINFSGTVFGGSQQIALQNGELDLIASFTINGPGAGAGTLTDFDQLPCGVTFRIMRVLSVRPARSMI